MKAIFHFRIIAALAFLVPQSGLAETMSAKDFIKVALEQNLDLRLAKAESQAGKAGARGIRIPPPSVGVSQMNMANGQTARGWQVSQTIPFPTKITREHSARKHALLALEDQEVVARQEIISQAKFLYFLVWEIQEKRALFEEKRRVLREHIKIANSIAQSDTLAKIHVLKAESELDQIDNELETLSQVRQERLSVAAQLVDKDPATFKLIASNPGTSVVPNIASIDETPQVQAMNHHVIHRKMIEGESKSQWYPDFTVSYSHMEQTLRFPQNNQIMVGITLPFAYFWQPGAQSDQDSAIRLKTEIGLSKTKRQIQAEKVNLEKSIETLKKQISTFEDKILPKAKRRKKLFRNVAPRDLSSLNEHLETYLSIPKIHLQILKLRTQYEQAVAMLSKYELDKGVYQ